MNMRSWSKESPQTSWVKTVWPSTFPWLGKPRKCPFSRFAPLRGGTAKQPRFVSDLYKICFQKTLFRRICNPPWSNIRICNPIMLVFLSPLRGSSEFWLFFVGRGSILKKSPAKSNPDGRFCARSSTIISPFSDKSIPCCKAQTNRCRPVLPKPWKSACRRRDRPWCRCG